MSQGSLGAHLGPCLGPMLGPSWGQDGALLHVDVDIEVRPLLEAILGPTWPQLGSQEGPNPWALQGAAPVPVPSRSSKSSQEAPGPSKRLSRPLSWLDVGSNLGLCSTSQTPKTINFGPMFGRSALKTRPTFEINPSQVYLTRCAATVPRLRVHLERF